MKNTLLSILTVIFTIFLLEIFLIYNHYTPNYQTYDFDINGTINIVNDNPNDFYTDKRDKTVLLGDSYHPIKLFYPFYLYKNHLDYHSQC